MSSKKWASFTRGSISRPLNMRQRRQVYRIVNAGKQLGRSRQTTSESVGTTGEIFEISQLTKSNDRNNRQSDTVIVKKIRVQLGATMHASADVFQFRLLIVISKMGPLAVGDLPTDTLVLPDYDKMIVLYDRTVRIHDGIGCWNVDIRKKLSRKNIPGLKVGYDDDESATAAQIHPIYVYTISSDNTNQPSYTMLGEIWFYNND